MSSTLELFSSFLDIWKYKGPEEERYAVYRKNDDLISFRVFTISIMLIGAGFLFVDFTRPVDYFWVVIMRGGSLLLYGILLVIVSAKDFSPAGIQRILVIQIILTYVFYFIQESLAGMPFFFLPNVLLLFYYTAATISGLRFRYAVLIGLTVFIVFIFLTEIRTEEYYRSQYPNLVANLIISLISAGFIEKQKRKDFMQYSELLLRKDELDVLNDQKNRVISILSHDVSSPLRSIDGLLTTYERKQISKEELDHFLPDVKGRLDKVSFLVYSLVRWSRSQMKGFVVQKVKIDIPQLIKESIELVKPTLKEKNILVNVDVEHNLWAFADYEMVNLIVRNLVSNAVKFTPKGNGILIRSFRRENKIYTEVSNEGEEISDEVRDKLFTFQIRSNQGTANEAGTGLGLAMSQQFAILNGGKIILAPRDHSTNTFCLELSAT